MHRKKKGRSKTIEDQMGKRHEFTYVNLSSIFILIKLQSSYVCLNALISHSHLELLIRIEIMFLDRPFIEEDYRLYNITLQPIGAEQRVRSLAKASKLEILSKDRIV